MLQRESCQVLAFGSVAEAAREMQQGFRPDVALINTQMKAANDVPALTWLYKTAPAVPIIALSSSYDPRSIVEAMKMGASDVLVQPFDRLELRQSLRTCMKSSLSRSQKQVREIPLTSNTSFVFCSEQMRTIAQRCELIASTDLPVLILGESGTGKEILARFIHKMSACSKEPFLKVNCAAMPSDLLESELFGYEQGAFTGALKSKPGKFELCNHGTIFLDEIGEMPPGLQAKLLQVLQDGTFSRLGGRTTITVEVRVVAATNIDMRSAIAEHRFREDLYYRINGFSFSLPPLRARREEIPVLVRYFMQRMAEKYAHHPVNMPDDLVHACMQYPWPGNLRELENFVKRYLVLGDEQAMMAELSCDSHGWPRPGVSGDKEIMPPIGGLKKMMSNLKGEAEAKVISAALEKNGWKRKKTAAELKISYKALLYKMRQHGIIPPDGEREVEADVTM